MGVAAVIKNLTNASISEEFRADDITVTLELSGESRVPYSVSVVPQVDVVVTGSTIVQLTVLYNIQYNVSIATSLCEQSYRYTTVHRLVYGKLLNHVAACPQIYVLSYNMHTWYIQLSVTIHYPS